MTEEQIEVAVSRRVDALDARFMAGKLTQTEYDAAIKEIDAWALGEYEREETKARHRIRQEEGW